MPKDKIYTLTLSGQELHDLIEAALVSECQAAQIIGGLKRKGLDMDAQKFITQNARLARLVRRMQETKEDIHISVLLNSCNLIFYRTTLSGKYYSF